MQVSVDKIKQRISEVGRRRYMERQSIGPLHIRRVDGGGEDDRLANTGDRWGARDALYQMHGDISIPQEWRGEMLALHLDLSAPAVNWQLATAEALLSIDGAPLHAIDRYHREVILPPAIAAKDGFAVDLRVWNGIDDDHHVLHALELRRVYQGADRLHQTMRVWLDAIDHLAAHATVRSALLDALDTATIALDFRSDAAFYASCDAALELLTERLDALHGDATDPWQPHVTVTGHAHIDVAWLWRLRHTRMKAADTFATALYHMERYPHFTFTASTPQLYQFVKEDHPDLYARIQERVAAGQWEAEGAMWLEADTNITGGESLVRQFIYGKRFLQDEFGVDSRVLWLPDVFGYSATLPQLIKGAGAEYFITTKLSWNDTNRIPNDTFWWEGLDGTRVLTHFITAQNANGDPIATYNAESWPGVMARSWRTYRQQALNRELLVAYGWGDGGGGPTREMIEAAGMQSSPISRELPTATPGTVRAFMDRLAARVGDDPRLPTWVGELYFEYHRGTYTSQARTKRNNRHAERDLHNAEFLSVLAQHISGQPYPKKALDDAWRTVLTHQFHDILPGSSIGEVYADAEENYTHVRATTDEIVANALAALASDAPTGSLIVANTLLWPRTDLIEIDAAQADALHLPTQSLADGRALAQIRDVPGLGYRVVQRNHLSAQPGGVSFSSQGVQPPAASPGDHLTPGVPTELSITPNLLENALLRIEMNERGQITRIYDKEHQREVLAAGERGNVFQAFEDKPLNFDAWDIDAFYAQKMWEVDELAAHEVIEEGPLRGGVRLTWRYQDRTTITQRIYLYSDSRRIDFQTEIDWHERQTLLKVAFPVAIHSTHATAEIQFGNVRRPTHRNTSWERAQFETCAHKWIDLAEGDYGVALLNDCKYGYDVLENVMRLTLLKGAVYPDAHADEGQHQFTYSLYPHAGDWFAGNVHREAYALNFPLVHASVMEKPRDAEPGQPQGIAPTDRAKNGGEWGAMSVDVPNIIIETVKYAEKSDDMVLRVYECANRRGPFTMTLPFAAVRVEETNLLEGEPQPVALATDGLSFTSSIAPYQIKTFVISR